LLDGLFQLHDVLYQPPYRKVCRALAFRSPAFLSAVSRPFAWKPRKRFRESCVRTVMR
jgi:hypothetical protein